MQATAGDAEPRTAQGRRHRHKTAGRSPAASRLICLARCGAFRSWLMCAPDAPDGADRCALSASGGLAARQLAGAHVGPQARQTLSLVSHSPRLPSSFLSSASSSSSSSLRRSYPSEGCVARASVLGRDEASHDALCHSDACDSTDARNRGTQSGSQKRLFGLRISRIPPHAPRYRARYDPQAPASGISALCPVGWAGLAWCVSCQLPRCSACPACRMP